MNFKERIDDLSRKLNIEEKKKRMVFLEAQSQGSDFWKDRENASSTMRELSLLKKEIEEV